MSEKKFSYLQGWGNHFESEALPNTLPKGQNAPQVCPKGLYAEQLSGTAFTVPRHAQQRTFSFFSLYFNLLNTYYLFIMFIYYFYLFICIYFYILFLYYLFILK